MNTSLDTAVRSLKEERLKLVTKAERIDAAINALNGINEPEKTNGFVSPTGKKPVRRVLTAAARRRIAVAQRARWARFRAGKKAA